MTREQLRKKYLTEYPYIRNIHDFPNDYAYWLEDHIIKTEQKEREAFEAGRANIIHRLPANNGYISPKYIDFNDYASQPRLDKIDIEHNNKNQRHENI